jgi:aspartate racemase
MTRHIGIVGVSAEGAALCYRTICAEAPARMGAHRHPPVTVHTPPLADYVACLERGDLPGVATLMLDSARRLALAGADFLICPDNTVHQAFEHAAPRLPLPWLHIAEVVAAGARAAGHRRLGRMGTRWLVHSELYPRCLQAQGLGCVRPGEDDLAETDRIIMDELVPGQVLPGSVLRLCAVTQRLKEAGCDAVVLGCTELPLVLSDANAALPTLDSTRLLARAALDKALA